MNPTIFEIGNKLKWKVKFKLIIENTFLFSKGKDEFIFDSDTYENRMILEFLLSTKKRFSDLINLSFIALSDGEELIIAEDIYSIKFSPSELYFHDYQTYMNLKDIITSLRKDLLKRNELLAKCFDTEKIELLNKFNEDQDLLSTLISTMNKTNAVKLMNNSIEYMLKKNQNVNLIKGVFGLI